VLPSPPVQVEARIANRARVDFKRLDSVAIPQDNNWVRFTFYFVSHRAELYGRSE
jgi:hypothetical protein